jgi:hypothetical protein
MQVFPQVFGIEDISADVVLYDEISGSNIDTTDILISDPITPENLICDNGAKESPISKIRSDDLIILRRKHLI